MKSCIVRGDVWEPYVTISIRFLGVCDAKVKASGLW